MQPSDFSGPAESILQFWFGEIAEDGTVDDRRSKRWFEKDPEFDAEIRDRFEGTLQRAAAGELDPWRTDPHGALAFVVLCDQFPRNMYRGKPEAFAFDGIALEASRSALEAGHHDSLLGLEAAFLFMPFMHSENLEDQRQCVRLFEARAERADPGSRVQKRLATSADFAKRHMEIIERFGRFPHRNAILGRESTPEELEFLQQPGSSF